MAVDLTGSIFGRLTAISFVGGKKWLCACVCGGEAVVSRSNLVAGNSTSCGCKRRETTSRLLTKHGGRRTSEYKIWLGVKQRCLNPKNPSYRHYGGRGITVCVRWAESFERFLADVGPRPSMSHTIDRKDNKGNYEPGNCRWATHTEQMNNTRRNRLVTVSGETMTLSEAERRGQLAVPAGHVASRVHAGWDIDAAVSTPSKRRGNDHAQSKLNEQAVIQIRAMCGAGATQDYVAQQFGVSQAVISRIVHNKIWRHVNV